MNCNHSEDWNLMTHTQADMHANKHMLLHLKMREAWE